MCVVCDSEEGFFRAQLKFPDDFPNNPPEMKFLSEMWHPNSMCVYTRARVTYSPVSSHY